MEFMSSQIATQKGSKEFFKWRSPWHFPSILLVSVCCWRDCSAKMRGSTKKEEDIESAKQMTWRRKNWRDTRLCGEMLGLKRGPGIQHHISSCHQGPTVLWLVLWIPWKQTDSHSSPICLPQLPHPLQLQGQSPCTPSTGHMETSAVLHASQELRKTLAFCHLLCWFECPIPVASCFKKDNNSTNVTRPMWEFIFAKHLEWHLSHSNALLVFVK